MANLNFNTKSALKGTFSVEIQICRHQAGYSSGGGGVGVEAVTSQDGTERLVRSHDL